jgi:hypothetical protein
MQRTASAPKKRKVAETKVKSKATPVSRTRGKSHHRSRPLKPLNSSNKKPSPLLTLAPELRARIWQYALIEDEPILINEWKHGSFVRVKQPPLLRTSRQIRNEAIGIWFTDNTFLFKACVTLSFKPLLPFCKQVRKYHQDPKARIQAEICRSTTPFGIDGTDLDDLMEWLKLYHSDPDLIPIPAQDADAFLMMSKTLASATFGVVKGMLARPWEAVELKLSAHMLAIIDRTEEETRELMELDLLDQIHVRTTMDMDDIEDDFGTDSGDEYDDDDESDVEISIEDMD